jgi:hypothetical protein
MVQNRSTNKRLNLISSIFIPHLLGLTLLFSFLSCQNNQEIRPLSSPCKIGGEPNLFVSKDGKVLLSWVEYIKDSIDVLAFSYLEGEQWSAPKIIAKGNNWFVNWADFPSIVAYDNSSDHLAAHWLQKSAKGKFDYDIRIAQSLDGGNTWQKSFVLHSDGIAAEHGFVSMLPVGENKMFATWLDGRYTKTENSSDGHDHEGQQGAMTLRGAFFNPQGQVLEEFELDDRICDCCQTSAALTSNGPIIAYRDRTEEEIRDISIVRQVGKDWTRPRNISKDNWEIAGCPVNGPKIIASGNKVALAWFTMANDTAKVQLVLSNDGGAHFSAPILIDDGKPLGRVGLAFIDDDVVVSWLEQLDTEEAAIRLAKVSNQSVQKKLTLTKTSASRSSGFPIMKSWNNQLVLAWTEVLDEAENTSVRTALVEMKK